MQAVPRLSGNIAAREPPGPAPVGPSDCHGGGQARRTAVSVEWETAQHDSGSRASTACGPRRYMPGTAPIAAPAAHAGQPPRPSVSLPVGAQAATSAAAKPPLRATSPCPALCAPLAPTVSTVRPPELPCALQCRRWSAVPPVSRLPTRWGGHRRGRDTWPGGASHGTGAVHSQHRGLEMSPATMWRSHASYTDCTASQHADRAAALSQLRARIQGCCVCTGSHMTVGSSSAPA
jgi:hypothetical protein